MVSCAIAETQIKLPLVAAPPMLSPSYLNKAPPPPVPGKGATNP